MLQVKEVITFALLVYSQSTVALSPVAHGSYISIGRFPVITSSLRFTNSESKSRIHSCRLLKVEIWRVTVTYSPEIRGVRGSCSDWLKVPNMNMTLVLCSPL